MGLINTTTERTKNILDQTVSSVLEFYNAVQNGMNKDEMKDGVNFINITSQGETELGKMLFITYSHPFNTFLGRCANIKNFMTAITRSNFPLNFLTKTRFTKEEKAKIFADKSRVINVPNYWALVAYAFIERVKADKKLQEMLVNNTLDYVSFRVSKDKVLFNKIVNITYPDESLVRYIAIVKHVEALLKEGKFNKDNIDKFINDCKYHPELNILDGIATNISIKDNEANEAKDSSDVNANATTLENDEAVE